MSLTSQILSSHALVAAMQNLKKAESNLEQHLSTSYEEVKADFEEIVAHFKNDVAALRARFDADVLKYIDLGMHPTQAVNQVENDKTTVAATEATAALHVAAAAQFADKH